MIIALIISGLIFSAYVITIALKYGVQKSISDSYYNLPGKWKFIFTGVLWSFTLPVIIVGNNALMFLAGAAIFFVGASPVFKNDRVEKKIHIIGAVSGIILGILSVIIVYELYAFVVLAALLSILLYFKATNSIWWIEIVAFVVIWSATLINSLN